MADTLRMFDGRYVMASKVKAYVAMVYIVMADTLRMFDGRYASFSRYRSCGLSRIFWKYIFVEPKYLIFSYGLYLWPISLWPS